MSDPNSTPSGGDVPPKPPEAAKVQPKKETVRINLPPKPSAVPTIKIPAPPAPAAVTARPVAAMGAASAAPAAAHAAAAPPSAPRVVASAPVVRSPAAMRPSAPAVSGLDTGLAIAGVVLCVAVLVRLVLVLFA